MPYTYLKFCSTASSKLTTVTKYYVEYSMYSIMRVVQRKYMIKEGNRRVQRRKMSPNLLFKLSWVRKKIRQLFGCTCIYNLFVYGPASCWGRRVGGVWTIALSLKTHKSLNPKTGDIFSRCIPLLPSLSIFFFGVVSFGL
jgi:hypothetical protein